MRPLMSAVAPAVALALAGVVALPGFTSPASAAPGDSISDLQTALTTCTGPTAITLTETLVDTTAALDVACDTTINLAGHDLTVRNVVVATGKTLTVADSTLVSGGTLTADASSANGKAGIRTTGAALVTSGTAHLTATGGQSSAGIGGAPNGAGGSTTSNDSSSIAAIAGSFAAAIGGGSFGGGGLTASNGSSSIIATGGVVGAGIGGGYSGAGGTTTSNDTSSITATGGAGDISDPDDPYGAGAGIGGGPGGTGAGTTTINGGSTMTATGGAGASAVGLGQDGAGAAGTFLDVVDGTLRLPGGSTLDLPGGGSGPRVTIGADGLITGNGTITGAGRVANGGAITLPPANITASSVSDHHYAVTFDTDGGSTAPDPVTVFAGTFTRGDRELPADPTRTDYTFDGWFTQVDGAGTRVTATSTLPGTSSDGAAVAITAYASWTPVSTPPPATTPIVVPTPVVSPASPVVGDVLTATVGATTPAGATLSYQWNRTGTAIAGADQATYTTAQADVGARLSVTVTATMSGYDTGRSTSAPTEPVQDIPVSDGTIPDPRLELEGTPRVGDTVTGTITRPDIDGLTLTWQWQRLAEDEVATAIAGATGPTYTPRPGQLDQQLRLVLTLTAAGYTTLVVHRDSGPVRAGLLDRLHGRVTGTAAPGRRLTVTTTPLAHAPAGYTITYQWRLDGRAINNDGDRRVYRPRPRQVGGHLTVTVTASAPGYTTREYVSRPRLVHPRGWS